MVAENIAQRGIRDPAVLAAFLAVPREEFVPEDAKDLAYEDAPLPIGHDQTISQPYVVALTVQALALRPGARVLEIGTGSGYAAASLASVAAEVVTVERVEALARAAERRLSSLGYANVRVIHGDGSLGVSGFAPYDGIAVAAGACAVPAPLAEQLAVGGRLVIPIGPPAGGQHLVRITRTGAETFATDDLGSVRFVPLVLGTPVHLH
jgi:protein-L-isoaspartate(D-aspartate) O-methyltransferase